MLRLNQIATQELVWEKPHMLKEEFFLRDNETVLATLGWEKSWGSQAQAETSDGIWTFNREGVFKRVVTIHLTGTEAEIGRVEFRWDGSGIVNLADGMSFYWGKNKAWKGSWSFFSPNNEPLCSIKAKHSLSKDKAFVKIEPAGSNLLELPLLVVLSWYLVILKYKDDSAAAASASATTVVVSGS